MEFTHDFTTDSARLTGVVRGVRNRWRLKRVLRGATIALGAGFLASGISLAVESTMSGARRLLFASLIYLPVLLLVMALDRVPL